MKDLIKEYILKKALIFKNNEEKFLFTENNSLWILDFRKIFLDAEALSLFASFFWDTFEELYPFQLGCLELWSVPFLTALILEWKKRGKLTNGFIIRKQRKKSGLGNIIEWYINDEKILFIDDTFNSGKSIVHGIKVLEEEGRKIDLFYTFVNFCNPDGKELLQKFSLNYEYEFTLSDLWLDTFGNSDTQQKTHKHTPIIYPPYRRIYSGQNANRFLFVPKTTLQKNGKNIYVWGEGAGMVKISADTGEILKEFRLHPTTWHKNIISTPVLFWDTIAFWAYDGNFYALDTENLRPKWIFDEADWIGSSPDYSETQWLIFVGLEHAGESLKWSLVALDSQTWTKVWQLFTNDFIHSSPRYNKVKNTVTVGTNDGDIIIVDALSGEIVCSQKLVEAVRGGFDYADSGEVVYFWSHTKSFYAMNTKTGEIIFEVPTANFVYSTPLVVKNNIFFSGLDQKFYHIDTSGELIKCIETFGRNFVEPIFIEESIVVFGSNDGWVYFYDFHSKRVIFKIQHPERIVSRFVYDEVFKTIYVYDFMNQIYAYCVAGYIPIK